MPEITRYVTLKELTGQAIRVLKVTTKSRSQYTVGLVGSGRNRAVVVRGRSADGSKMEFQDPMGALENGRSLFEIDPSEWVGQSLIVGSLATSSVAHVEEITAPEEVTSFAGHHLRAAALAAGGHREEAAPVQPPPPSRSSAAAPGRSSSSAPAPVQRTPSAPTPPPPRSRTMAPETRAARLSRFASKEETPPLIVEEPLSRSPLLEVRPAVAPVTELERRVRDLEHAAHFLLRAHQGRDLFRDLDRDPALLDRFEKALTSCGLSLKSLLDLVNEAP